MVTVVVGRLGLDKRPISPAAHFCFFFFLQPKGNKRERKRERENEISVKKKYIYIYTIYDKKQFRRVSCDWLLYNIKLQVNLL